MDRSSNSVKIEKIRRALETKNYDTALKVAKTVDSARIKSAADLSVVAEAYDKNGIYDTALVYYEQIYLKSKTRRILIHLINLCLKLSMADMAELYLRDFSEMAPRDFYRHIFRYHIDKLRGEDLDVLIYDLEMLKAENFMEDWAYELAKLYHRSGQSEKCIAECNDIILWFGNGMYVDRARGLRAIHLSRLGRGVGSTEEGIAQEVQRLVAEGKSTQELEEFIEEATMPEGNTHYSEEEYNQERFGQPVYEEEGKDVIWNTREFGAITDEMIQQQNTMDLLQGMQVAEQLRMHLGAGQEVEIEKPEETPLDVFGEELSDAGTAGEMENFVPPKDVFRMEAMEEEESTHREDGAKHAVETDRALYQMIEQGQSEEELSKTIRQLTAEEDAKGTPDAVEKYTTKKLHFFGRKEKKKEVRVGSEPTAEFAAFRTGAKILTTRVGGSGFKQEAEKEDAPGTAETMAAEEVVSFRREEKEAGHRGNHVAGEEAGSAKRVFQTAAEPEKAKPVVTTTIPEKAKSAFTTAEKPEKAKPVFGTAKKQEQTMPVAATGKQEQEKPVAAQDPEVPQPVFMAGYPPVTEEPLPQPDDEMGNPGMEEPETENPGIEEPMPEDMEEPEPLYEYPEEIMADYAKEAPHLDASLREAGMKLEEFFGGFLASADIRKQLFHCMEQILAGRSQAINIILTGGEKSGKTSLAKAIAKCTQVLGGIPSPRVALIRGDKLNHISLSAKKEQLRGSTVLIEKASLMNAEKVAELLEMNREFAGKTAVILEDERSHMNLFLRKNEELLRVYQSRIDLPGWTLDDLFLQALSILYRNEYQMTESVAVEFLGAVRDCIRDNPKNPYDAVCGYTEGVLKRAEKRMSQMLREFSLDETYREQELTMLREEDL